MIKYYFLIFFLVSDAYSNIFLNKNILITGGTGFLGRSLIDELLKCNPNKVRIFSRDEVKHFNISKNYNLSKLELMLGDVRDYESVIRATKDIDFVIHAAALKRIDALEFNIAECIKTNLMGSYNVFNACLVNNVKKAVLVSTDKACLPVNAYGACKFISEKIFSNYSRFNTKTIFDVVRYGNVLDSTGSVFPYFKERILISSSLDITDERMTRFIISKERATKLIFTALEFGLGGEIFVPRLPAFRILDVVDLFKKYNSNKNIKINVIGIRPGEKIHELMVGESESIRTYHFDDDSFVILPTNADYELKEYYEKSKLRLENQCAHSSENSVVSSEELECILKANHILGDLE